MGMRAKDMMDPAVLTVDEDLDIRACARTMVAHRKGYSVLLRGGVTLAGIVTEWDIVEKVIAAGRDPAEVRAREIATPTIHSCAPETPADEVIAQMAKEGVRRMIVLSDGRAVGVITARTVLANFRSYVDQLSAQIAGYRSDPTAVP